MKKLIYTALVITGVILIGSGHTVVGGCVLGALGVLAVLDAKEEAYV